MSTWGPVGDFIQWAGNLAYPYLAPLMAWWNTVIA